MKGDKTIKSNRVNTILIEMRKIIYTIADCVKGGTKFEGLFF